MTKQAAKRRIAQLADRFELLFVYVFGSRAKEALTCITLGEGRLTPGGSDLDVAVFPQRPLGIDDKVAVAGELEELFGVERVDLIDLTHAPGRRANAAVCGELLYAADPDSESRYQLLVMRKAAELTRFQKERERAVLGF